ncbi:nucleotidyltransferase family protein [uncultured Polaribacter sp.]|uniref:nucleotidyltransferase family protein n=1 Tax=uncultured Polaribacter sp. TaxID=174711 RepID=UPI00262C94D6|nr:nucleotidyltransferase family protein [uncultured Polaribacter sp.]
MTKIAILVLAGGQSTRMKTPKQLVKLGNNYLLETVLNKAKDIKKNHVYCVLGANADLIRREIACANIRFIYNKNHTTGLSASIVAGTHFITLQKEKYDGLLVLLGDQPAIEKEYLLHLITEFSKDSLKIISSNYKNKPGVPAIFPTHYFSKLKLMKGDFGAKEILKNNKDVVISKKTSNFIDIDTPEDLENFKKLLLKKD